MSKREQEALEYRDRMDCPMEYLSVALWGVGEPGPKQINLSDAEIVEIAARKIETLKKMLLATGFNAELLKAIIEE